MGSITNGAYTTTSSNYGTEMKNLVEKMVAISGFTIIEVVTNSTSIYEAYISAFDNTDCLIKVRNSSRTFYAKRYYYDPNGTDTVAGRTYVASGEELSISININSIGNTTSFIGVQTDNIRLCIVPGNGGGCFGFAKMKDIFTGEEIYMVSIGYAYFYCGSGSLGEKKYSCDIYSSSSAPSHPYVRVYPAQYCMTSGQNIVNTSDLELCKIAQGSNWLAPGVGSIVSVNGHKYIQIYISGGIFVRYN